MCTARLQRLIALLAVLLNGCTSIGCAAEPAALRSESRRVACTDVGVHLHIRRTSAMPLEELSELHTGKACARTTAMTTIADDAESVLVNASLDLVDCVTTRVDEELLGVFAVIRVCDRQEDSKNDGTIDAWDARMRPQLERLFHSARGASQGLLYYGSIVEFESPSIPPSYTRLEATGRGDESEDVPRFRYKLAELWSVPHSSATDKTLILLKLEVTNDGSVPLHVFAATVKKVDLPLPNGMLLLRPDKVDPIMPSAEVSLLFRFEARQIVELTDDANYAIYFAHTSSRAHILEGQLVGKKLRLNSDKKKSPNKAKNDLFSVHKIDDTASLEAAHTRFPYGIWQLASIGIVMTVGLFTTLYMRRKWTRVKLAVSSDCFKRTKLKHKSSNLSKMTELTTKQATGDPEDPANADTQPNESDSLLVPQSPSTKSQLMKPEFKLRGRMPAITMQWKKPTILRDKLSIRRNLKLDSKERLHPKDFECLWEEFIQRHSASFNATKRPTVEVFVQAMAVVGILCMASGTVNGVEKYMLYAKQADSDDFFFVSVDVMVDTNETVVIVRTNKNTNEKLVEQFIVLIDNQLDILLK